MYGCRPKPFVGISLVVSCLFVQSAVCVFMVHQHVERLRKLLRQSESKCADGEAKLADSEAKRANAEGKLAERESKLAEREAKLLERERVIASLQDNKVSLQETLKQSMLETNMGKLARQACEEEITLLKNRSEVILESLDSLEEEKLARKQHHYKAKNSVLRSFQWKEKEIDPVILEGAVAFWAATGEKDCTGTSNTIFGCPLSFSGSEGL